MGNGQWKMKWENRRRKGENDRKVKKKEWKIKTRDEREEMKGVRGDKIKWVGNERWKLKTENWKNKYGIERGSPEKRKKKEKEYAIDLSKWW